MQDEIVALFAYDRWANRTVLDACRKLTAEQYVAEPVPGWSSVRSTISHIALAAEFNLRTLAVDPHDYPDRSRAGHGGRRGPVAGTYLPPFLRTASHAHAGVAQHRADGARDRPHFHAAAVRSPPNSNGSGSNNRSRTS